MLCSVHPTEVFIMPHRFLLESSHSSGFQWNPEEKKWQRGQPILPFQGVYIPVEYRHSGIETGMFPGIDRNRMYHLPIDCHLSSLVER